MSTDETDAETSECIECENGEIEETDEHGETHRLACPKCKGTGIVIAREV